MSLAPGDNIVVRIAAKGDGVTASGAFVAGAAPGDVLLDDGTLRLGEHHATPPCRHFGTCGGCQLQQLDDASLADFVRERVVNAAAGQGLSAALVGPAHLSPSASRRRATLHAAQARGRMVLGYREGGSHALVDLAECPVLAPELAALVAPLRKMLARQVMKKGARLAVDAAMTLCDQGLDLALRAPMPEGLAETEMWLDFARAQGLARLGFDHGYGAEALWEPEPVTVTLSGIAVALPSGAFLQPTADGEAALVGAAVEWLGECGAVADLFAGLGTFGFALARGGTKVLAVEADQAAHLACNSAARRAGVAMKALHRDLFRNPLLPAELGRFDAVLLDPPRAGAREQVARLAASSVARIVYISCNPASWARDAATLVGAGYKLAELRPVGQFRWSTHVELASLFVKAEA